MVHAACHGRRAAAAVTFDHRNRRATAPARDSTDTLGIDWLRPAAPIHRPPVGNWDAAFLTGPCGVRRVRVGTGPVLDHGTSGARNDLRVLSPDVVQQADGTLLMAAYGQRTSDPGVNAGSIAFWRSRPATP